MIGSNKLDNLGSHFLKEFKLDFFDDRKDLEFFLFNVQQKVAFCNDLKDLADDEIFLFNKTTAGHYNFRSVYFYLIVIWLSITN